MQQRFRFSQRSANHANQRLIHHILQGIRVNQTGNEVVPVAPALGVFLDSAKDSRSVRSLVEGFL
eukprot:5992376-Amphidinium_carterae.1